jgi:hypothetical protein
VHAEAVTTVKPRPAKTPTVAIARILKDTGLTQGHAGDFCVRGFYRRGERIGTMVVLFNRGANETVAANADTIARASEEAGWVFGVGIHYSDNGKVWCDVSNFGGHPRHNPPK